MQSSETRVIATPAVVQWNCSSYCSCSWTVTHIQDTIYSWWRSFSSLLRSCK